MAARQPGYREMVLEAFAALEQRGARREFTIREIVGEVQARYPWAKESTIRTHITSRMCVQAPEHHAVTYPDLDRVDRGRYRRRV